MPERSAEPGRTSMAGAEAAAAPLSLQLLGPWDARVHGQPMRSLRSRKGQWLLALLALQHGRTVERDWLAGILWRDSSSSQGLYNLRRNLTDLRGALGPEDYRLQTPSLHTLALDLAGADVDLFRFDESIARGDRPSLEAAVRLYQGPLLVECYEDWITAERAVREQAYLGALETLSREARARGELEDAARYQRQSLEVDPLRESAQQLLMEILVERGDVTAALLVFREYRLRLHREAAAAPGPEIAARFEELRHRARSAGRRPTGTRAGARRKGFFHGRAQPGEPEAISPPIRLPHSVSSFVGRDRELREIAESLPAARLLTLTGPGGVGKTRLALQVGAAVAADYPGGVWFVDLSRLADPALVPQAVAVELAVPEQPDRPLAETLAEFLRSQQLLLVLDNCEHLLAACAELVEALLARSPELRILATSRQSLGLTGEVVWSVPGLSVPPPVIPGIQAFRPGTRAAGDRLQDELSETPEHPNTRIPERLMQFEAARLFAERARGASSAFSLTERSARAVAEICRRLEGIPLAIELAAARLKALSVEEIAARLDDSFRLLTGGSRTAPPRHQTLRATMDWSYDLLSPPERLLLQRLSVFAGSFSLKAVESVCSDHALWVLGIGLMANADRAERSEADASVDPIQNPNAQTRPPASLPSPGACSSLSPRFAPPPEIQNTEVLELLTQLVDQSLVIVERTGDRRPVSPVVVETETRYRLLETVRQYALERLRAGTPRTGEREEARVRWRHLEFYLRLAEEVGPHLWGADQAAWLERLETERDNLRMALDWALDREPERELSLRLAAALAKFWIERRHLEEGRQRLVAALERAGSARRSLAGAWALSHLGDLCFLSDDYPAARAFYEEGLVLQRELGDPIGTANVLWGLGHVARRQGEYAEARALLEESLAVRRARGDRQGIAGSLIGLADTLREQGEDPAAWAGYYEEALAIRRDLGNRAGVADALGELANAAWRQGDYARARERREESLALWRAVGSPIGVIHSLGALGHLARDQSEFDDARAFYTESLHLRWELGDRFTLVQALEDFAELAAREGEWARMTRLFGAAEALRMGMGKPLPTRERAEYDRYLSGAREVLGEAAVAAEGKAGWAMSLEEAIAFALARG